MNHAAVAAVRMDADTFLSLHRMMSAAASINQPRKKKQNTGHQTCGHGQKSVLQESLMQRRKTSPLRPPRAAWSGLSLPKSFGALCPCTVVAILVLFQDHLL
jgi:hypothetical protein